MLRPINASPTEKEHPIATQSSEPTLVREFDSIPPSIVSAAAQGTLVIVVGAGASMQAVPPVVSWRKFVENLKRAANKKLKESRADHERAEIRGASDPIRAASLCRQVLGAEEYQRNVVRLFAIKRKHDVGPIYRALAVIEGATFVSTNYDLLLDRALQDHYGTPPKCIYIDQPDAIADLGPRNVLKLHGDVNRPEMIVATSSDYESVQFRHPGAWRSKLAALLQDREVLFVGHSFSDPDLTPILQTLRKEYKDAFRGPWWLGKSGLEANDLEQRSLRVLRVEAFDDIGPWLQALARAADSTRKKPQILLKELTEFATRQIRLDGDRATTALSESRYEDARNQLIELERSLLETLATTSTITPALASELGHVRLKLARCHLDFQEHDDAVATLCKIDATTLDPDSNATLAALWASLGNEDAARASIKLSNMTPIQIQTIGQVVALNKGTIPTDLLPRTEIQLGAARVELFRGDTAAASERAMALLRRDNLTETELSELSIILCEALWLTVLPQPTTTTEVPVTRRSSIIMHLDRVIQSQTESLRNPPPIRDQIFACACRYFSITEDDERLTRLNPDPERSDRAKRVHLKFKDHGEDAQPRSAWQRAFRRAQLLQIHGGDESEIRAEIEHALRDVPNHPLVAAMKAQLDLMRDPHSALAYARLAFDALPGRGQRLMLGRSLLACNMDDEAAQVLQDLIDTRFRPWVATVAYAFDRVGRKRDAASLLRDYLATAESDKQASIDLARLESELGNHTEAANRAWIAVVEDTDTLRVESFAKAAWVISAHRSAPERMSRLNELVRIMGLRYPIDDRTAQLRLFLTLESGGQTTMRQEDWDVLCAAGLAFTISSGDVPPMLATEAQRHALSIAAYRNGKVTFGYLDRNRNIHPTDILSSSINDELDHKNGGYLSFSPPISLFNLAPPLPNCDILIGSLELILLSHLRVLNDVLTYTSQNDIRIVMFRDVHDRIATDFSEPKRDRGALELHASLMRIDELISTRVIQVVHQSDEIESDERLARRRNASILGKSENSSVESLSVASAIRIVQERGAIDNDTAVMISLRFSSDASNNALPVGREIVVPLAILFSIPELSFWRGLVAPGIGALILSSETERELRRLRASTRARHQADADWGDAVRFLELLRREDRLKIIDRPFVEILPSSHAKSQVPRSDLSEALSWRWALRSYSTLALLSIDHAVVHLITESMSTEWATAIAWTESDLLTLRSHLRGVADRVISISEFVKVVSRSGPTVGLTEQLAKLGFIDALGANPGFLTDLALKFSHLDRGRPKDVLTSLARASANRDHVAAGVARVNLARAIAHAAWDIGCKSVDNVDKAIEFLNLADEWDPLTGTIMDQVLCMLAARALDDPAQSFARIDENISASTSDAHATVFWRNIREWAEGNRRRMVSIARAIRAAVEYSLRQSTSLASDQKQLVAIVVTQMSMAVGYSSGATVVDLADPYLEPLTYLGPLGFADPLEFLTLPLQDETSRFDLALDLDDVINYGAALTSHTSTDLERASLLFGGFFYPAPSMSKQFRVRAPSVALLMRAPSAQRPALARVLRQWKLGVDDGGTFDFLSQLEERPVDPDLLRDLARRILVSASRSVSEDISIIGTWGGTFSVGAGVTGPDSLDELRNLLAEPGPLPDENLVDTCESRVNSSRIWKELIHNPRFRGQLAAIPGGACTIFLLERLDSKDIEADIVQTFEDLRTNAAEFTSAELYRHILFLRVSLRRLSVAELDGRSIDLATELPRLLEQILSSLCAATDIAKSIFPDNRSPRNPSLNSISELEPVALRMIFDTVRRVSPYSTGSRDLIWITYRLFTWFADRWRDVPIDERPSQAARFQALHDERKSSRNLLSSIFDPLPFGRDDYDFRLSAFLCVIAIMDDMTIVIDRAKSAANEASRESGRPRPVTTPQLLSHLVQLASRVLRPSERRLRAINPPRDAASDDCDAKLLWIGPAAIPDLALMAILRHAPERLSELSTESRARWIEDLARPATDPMALHPDLRILLGYNLFHFKSEISGPERRHVAMFADTTAAPDEDARLEGSRTFAGIYLLASGDSQRLDILVDRVESSLIARESPAIAALLVESVLAAVPERALELVERLILKALGVGKSLAGDLATQIGSILRSRDDSAALATMVYIRTLEDKEPFKSDDRFLMMLRVLR